MKCVMYPSHEPRSHLSWSVEDGDENGDDRLEVDHAAESDQRCAFKVAHTNKQGVDWQLPLQLWRT